MSLPFFRTQKQASVVQLKKTDKGLEHEGLEGEHSPARMSAVEDMMRAFKSGDTEAAASAMKAHHEIMESEAGSGEDLFSMDDE